MGSFIQSLLNYGRAASSTPQLADCDCNAVVAAVLEDLKADLENSHAQIRNEPLPIIRADPVLMAQLFQNLIENGIKYCGKGPPVIHISSIQQKDHWLISVRDNGAGIPAEAQRRIFEPFHQGKGGMCKCRGVGLGLATCERIVERHGGRIGVESELETGSTFFFTVPRQAADRDHPAVAHPSEPRR